MVAVSCLNLMKCLKNPQIMSSVIRSVISNSRWVVSSPSTFEHTLYTMKKVISLDRICLAGLRNIRPCRKLSWARPRFGFELDRKRPDLHRSLHVGIGLSTRVIRYCHSSPSLPHPEGKNHHLWQTYHLFCPHWPRRLYHP